MAFILSSLSNNLRLLNLTFSNKLKTVVVFIMASFYVFTWMGYKQILGWPSTQEIPDEFRLIWVSIDEPDKLTKKEGNNEKKF